MVAKNLVSFDVNINGNSVLYKFVDDPRFQGGFDPLSLKPERMHKRNGQFTKEGELFSFVHYNWMKKGLYFGFKNGAKGLDVLLEGIRSSEGIIFAANVGLVYSCMGRYKVGNDDNFNSEGSFALLRSMRSFNYLRGFRFSTYACNAVFRALSRFSLSENRRRSRIIEYRDNQLCSATEVDQRISVAKNHEIIDEKLQLEKLILKELTGTEQKVIHDRFLLERKKTLKQLGRIIGVSKERVRQIELRALRKLRQDEKDVG
jgi:RNA polymerase sigma factor (sigma-70 family)